MGFAMVLNSPGNLESGSGFCVLIIFNLVRVFLPYKNLQLAHEQMHRAYPCQIIIKNVVYKRKLKS